MRTCSFSHFSRREFLKYSSILSASIPFNTATSSSASNDITGIIDTHIHLWAKDKKRFPYQENPLYAPTIASTVELWEEDRKRTGIEMAIFVQGAPYGPDHSFIFHCLNKAPDTLRGVCVVDPNSPDITSWEFGSIPIIYGVSNGIHSMSTLSGKRSAIWILFCKCTCTRTGHGKWNAR